MARKLKVLRLRVVRPVVAQWQRPAGHHPMALVLSSQDGIVRCYPETGLGETTFIVVSDNNRQRVPRDGLVDLIMSGHLAPM